MKRVDELLFSNSIVESRTKARALVEEGKVSVNGKVIDKPSRKFPESTQFEIDNTANTLKFVSRAGLKLEAFIKQFDVNVENVVALDAGASTGGFTDCILSFGAKKVYCVDVGVGQLHPKIQENPRVVNCEKTDARSLIADFFDEYPLDFICADLSFISLEKVFQQLWDLLKVDGLIICLVKPQFETAPQLMRKNKGIIRDDILRQQALDKIKNFISENIKNTKFIGEMQSPIKGGDGNVEYLIGYRKIIN